MNNSQLQRIINLIKKTGEKTVIMDNESDAVLMLMDLSVYEKMLDRSSGVEKLTEEELLEKINRDVAVWRAYNEKDLVEVDEDLAEKPVLEKERVIKTQPSRPVNFSIPENKEITLNKYPDIEIAQEEPASDIASEEEEEKFYLEPIE